MNLWPPRTRKNSGRFLSVTNSFWVPGDIAFSPSGLAHGASPKLDVRHRRQGCIGMTRAVRTLRRPASSGRKPLAAFSAATLQHALAAIGGLAGTEAVLAFANELARLISALHGSYSKMSVGSGAGTRFHMNCPRVRRIAASPWALARQSSA